MRERKLKSGANWLGALKQKWKENKDWLYNNRVPIAVRFFTVALIRIILYVWCTPPLLSRVYLNGAGPLLSLF